MKKLIAKSFYVSIAATLISQVPQILASGLSSNLQGFWILPLILIVLDGGFKLNNFLLFNTFLIVIISLGLLLFHVFGIRSYLDSPHLVNIYKSFIILIISFNVSPYLNKNRLSYNLGWISLVTGLILSTSVYFFSFYKGYSMTSSTYAYAAKNSISQIILTCIILVVFLLNFKNREILICIKYFFIIFGVYLLFILKSRATILGLILAIFYILLKSDNRKLKLGLFLMMLSIFCWLYFNQEISSLIYKGILLAGRDGSNLNEASSGRVNFYFDFVQLFRKQYLWGYGHKFTESFPLSVLLDYGIIWSIFIFIFVLAPIYFNFRFKLLNSNPLVFPFSVLILVYYSNSIFEQQAPIGPGTKNFFLWVFFGLLLYQYKSRKTIH